MSAAVRLSGSSPAVWLIRVSLLAIAAFSLTKSLRLGYSFLGFFIALSCITPLALSWLLTVTRNVPEPYLDEVFHIPQAQVYCQGRYFEWDDKITTPPGLYFSTIAFNRLLGVPCSVYNLRAFNVFVISSISAVVVICRARLAQAHAKSGTDGQVTVRDVVPAINIALFPVLFFFSGLYYTDPASTLIVLLAYANHLTRVGTKQPSFLNDVYALTLGIITLGFRQTNIFWVVVYIGGLEVIHAIKSLKPESVKTPNFRTLSEQIGFYAWRYSLGDIHDPSLSHTQPADVILCVISIGIAAVCNLPIVLRRFIWPHGVVLAAFAAFVAWNGGVVLGDKSNHVATLHLSQMLYIWPFFAFFSAPLFVPRLFKLANAVFRSFASPARQKSAATNSDCFFSLQVAVPVLVGCAALAVALLTVRFNTIIHPFTLADNRHYVFYVFRYSILRAWWIRYALAPVYVVCAWMCWCALGGSEVPREAQEKWIQSPFTPTSQKKSPQAPSRSGEAVSARSKNTVEAEVGQAPPPTSTVLMLLLATTLSLMTAPLVELRYFILPWVFWRLLVPSTSIPSLFSPPHESAVSSGRGLPKGSRQGSERSNRYVAALFLETIWFMAINATIMYVFVTRPFYWRAPDGTIQDGGRLQRFMW
ncbi:DIE2/ALG10 family-domain-containing protein [Xylaria palmicola]|nr:DIE2/ALG10 family-domain-containing protein [Xylaria palmicola]